MVDKFNIKEIMEYTNDSILEGIRKYVTIVNNPPT
jgi:hypothetical protein